MDQQLLTVSSDRVGDSVVVHAAGEVDMATAPTLESAVDAAVATAAGAGALVVDLSEVTFFGSTGLAVLVAAHQRCGSSGLRLRVVASSPAVLRPLELTALDKTLDLAGSVSEAVGVHPS